LRGRWSLTVHAPGVAHGCVLRPKCCVEANARDQRIRELEADNARPRATNEQLLRRLQEQIEEVARQPAWRIRSFRRKDKDNKPPEQRRPDGSPVSLRSAGKPHPRTPDTLNHCLPWQDFSTLTSDD
jgi:hypothetical protein